MTSDLIRINWLGLSRMRIKIYLFQKNELDIINQWIEYHSRIVGYNNLTVVDHMSTDGSYNTLLEYAEKGVTISRYSGQYTNKGKVLTKLIKKDNCDIAIPMDTDEFLVVKQGDQLVTDPLEVRSNLEKQLTNGCLDDKNKMVSSDKIGRYQFGFIYNLANIVLYPKQEDLKYFEKTDFTKPTNELGKSFFRTDHFISTDLGNHYGQIRTGSKSTILGDIGLLHYKVRGVPHYLNKTTKAQQAFNFNKKGSNSSSGRHWRIDYDAYRLSGAEDGFKKIHLIDCDRDRDLFCHQLFPLPDRPPDIDSKLAAYESTSESESDIMISVVKQPRVWKKRVIRKVIRRI